MGSARLDRRRRGAALLAVLGACAGSTGCARSAPPQPNVLLITIDTLRADRLSCYGYERATSPNLDRLAAEGLRYTHVQAPRAKTTPSIASLLSGQWPHEHGVRDLAEPLDASVPLLQEVLRAAGYRTAAIVGNWVLGDARSGLARGFDLWCEEFPDVNAVPPDGAPERKARSLTDGALAALGLRERGASNTGSGVDSLAGAAPWFLWLHYMDPHGAYDAPAEHRVFRSEEADPIVERAAGDFGLHRYSVATYNAPAQTRMADGRIDANAVRDLYDAEIRYVDHELGRLFDALRAAGAFESTLVIVTSDHGESLGEHLYWFEHGRYAYESTCRVPLIVRLPGPARSEPATRGDDLSLCDLGPALLEHLDLATAHRGQAQLARAAPAIFDAHAPKAPSPRAVFCEKVERPDLAGAVQIKAVRAGDWKLIQRYAIRAPRAGLAGVPVLLSEELYDLASDPREEHNLADPAPTGAPLSSLRRELARFVAADRDLGSIGELLRRQREGLEQRDPDAARILRALGY